MANQNTAIHDLLAGLQRKPLSEDPDDDVLFAGSRGTMDGPRRTARGTAPPPLRGLFEMPPPPPVASPLPSPQAAVSLPYLQQQPERTTRVAKTSKKVYLIPAALAIGAAVVVAVMMGSGDPKATTVASAASTKEPAAMTLPAAAPAPAQPTPPSVTPIAEPAAAAAAVPSVTPIEPPAAPKDAVAPAEVVPASTFTAKSEATMPTVPTAPAAVAAGDDKKEDAAAPADEAPAPKAKKSKRQSAQEKRAAKRASKRDRATKKVAAATPTAKKESTEADLGGNGALAVSSGQPREVWVDGRNSKRMTPLRVLLKPGKHKVTLFDKAKGTAKTFEVEIKPNTTTKVAK